MSRRRDSGQGKGGAAGTHPAGRHPNVAAGLSWLLSGAAGPARPLRKDQEAGRPVPALDMAARLFAVFGMHPTECTEDCLIIFRHIRRAMADSLCGPAKILLNNKTQNMKKLLLAVAVILCVTAITVQAKDSGGKKAKKALTAEQKQVQTDMLAKYDANKDGKLDKKEKAAMSQQDKDAWAKAVPAKKKKKGGGDAAASKAEGDK